jgi:putative membrane protein
MRTHQLLPIAALVTLAALPLVACAHTFDIPEDVVGQTTTTSGFVAAPRLDDAQIAEVLQAACAAALDESSTSAPFTPDANVAEYERLLNDEYRAARDAERLVIEEGHLVPQLSRASVDFTATSQRAQSFILGRTGSDFEQAFLGHQVTTQQKLLKLIDTELLPGARSDAQRRQLLELRPVVARLLSQATELQTWVMSHPNPPRAM